MENIFSLTNRMCIVDCPADLKGVKKTQSNLFIKRRKFHQTFFFNLSRSNFHNGVCYLQLSNDRQGWESILDSLWSFAPWKVHKWLVKKVRHNLLTIYASNLMLSFFFHPDRRRVLNAAKPWTKPASSKSFWKWSQVELTSRSEWQFLLWNKALVWTCN